MGRLEKIRQNCIDGIIETIDENNPYDETMFIEFQKTVKNYLYQHFFVFLQLQKI